MNEVILVAIQNTLNNLLTKYFTGLFIQFPLLLHVVQQLAPLQILHDNRHLHVFQSQAVRHLHNILMLQRFQNLSLHEN